MKTIATILGGVILACTLLAEAAFAQPPCGERAEITAELLREFKEQPRAMGIANNGGVVELYRTDSGSTWTLIVTLPNGLTCPMAVGEGWEALPLPVKGEAS